ncbi:MAG: hypothetical protein IJ682_06175 [Lachnospiraceae bacterium]|nr:hypothetical protein [Lachnospiraceae bacterium]
MEKIPLLLLVVAAGLILRGAGAVGELKTGRDYHFLQAPVYTVVLDGISEEMGVGNAGTAPDEEQAKVEEEEEPAVEEEAGYVSAEEEANRTDRPLEDVIEERKEASKGTYIYSGLFPEEATRPVLPAMDYGVADPYYMDPEDTVYEYPKKGVFQQNHDYYAFRSVKNRYFDDALFIGDSQTDGLYNYTDLRYHASFYALESVTIYNVFDVRIPFRTETENYETSLAKVLKKHDYRKIYICVGMNEMGVPKTTDFRNEYKKVIRRIRKAQPDAIIYIQGVVHVSGAMSWSDPAFNNKNLVQRNEAISKLANGHDIFYIEPSEALCDGNGDLRMDYTNDNVHLTAHYYPLWLDYLKQYAIVRNEDDK